MIVPHEIPLTATNYLNKLVSDYLKEDAFFNELISNKPTLDGFQKQLKLKADFPAAHRKVLVDVLSEQYKNQEISDATHTNIQLLNKENTYTITTGHQLNLASGPLYVIYKILSAINLTEELKIAFKDYYFVPVFWMATEDHDFEEINHFHIGDESFRWESNQTGAVGEFTLDGIQTILDELHKKFKYSSEVSSFIEVLEKAYAQPNLSKANRYLINELLGTYGLVILDANHPKLKSLFKKQIHSEFKNQSGFKNVTQTNEYLKKNYNGLVNPREFNLFYKKDSIRERIIFKNQHFEVLNSSIRFKVDELLNELEQHPEYFSPNVLMRPLYQEVILPNLAYIGGGGEIAYWLELKRYFDAEHVVFPILMVRNSLLVLDEKQSEKVARLGMNAYDLVLPQDNVIKNLIKKQSLSKFDFSEQKQFLEQQFKKLAELVAQTDYSFKGAVDAQRAKQLKGLEKLEKRWLKAELKCNQDLVKRLQDFLESINKNKVPQERYQNYVSLLLSGFSIAKLKEVIKPLKSVLTVLMVKE